VTADAQSLIDIARAEKSTMGQTMAKHSRWGEGK